MNLYTKSGTVKYRSECAPNNGYFLIPLYDKVTHTHTHTYHMHYECSCNHKMHRQYYHEEWIGLKVACTSVIHRESMYSKLSHQRAGHSVSYSSCSTLRFVSLTYTMYIYIHLDVHVTSPCPTQSPERWLYWWMVRQISAVEERTSTSIILDSPYMDRSLMIGVAYNVLFFNSAILH